jgi:hypothetical protein
MWVEYRIGEQKYKTTRQSDKGFSTLTYPFYIIGQLFSDLASENTELLASLASVLKNLFTPLFIVKKLFPGTCIRKIWEFEHTITIIVLLHGNLFKYKFSKHNV